MCRANHERSGSMFYNNQKTMNGSTSPTKRESKVLTFTGERWHPKDANFFSATSPLLLVLSSVLYNSFKSNTCSPYKKVCRQTLAFQRKHYAMSGGVNKIQKLSPGFRATLMRILRCITWTVSWDAQAIRIY